MIRTYRSYLKCIATHFTSNDSCHYCYRSQFICCFIFSALSDSSGWRYSRLQLQTLMSFKLKSNVDIIFWTLFQCNNLLLLAVTKRNSNIALILFFLYRLTTVSSSCRGYSVFLDWVVVQNADSNYHWAIQFVMFEELSVKNCFSWHLPYRPATSPSPHTTHRAVLSALDGIKWREPHMPAHLDAYAAFISITWLCAKMKRKEVNLNRSLKPSTEIFLCPSSSLSLTRSHYLFVHSSVFCTHTYVHSITLINTDSLSMGVSARLRFLKITSGSLKKRASETTLS